MVVEEKGPVFTFHFLGIG